jgi:hypothetical protein
MKIKIVARIETERAIVHGKWWANEKEGNHVNARAWANAGWQVDTVNLQEKWVRFTRK